jgi:hypothetical protein
VWTHFSLVLPDPHPFRVAAFLLAALPLRRLAGSFCDRLYENGTLSRDISFHPHLELVN